MESDSVLFLLFQSIRLVSAKALCHAYNVVKVIKTNLKSVPNIVACQFGQ